MAKLTRNKKITIIIVAILMALVVMSVVFMAVAESVAGDIASVTLAAKRAGIDKDKAYSIVDSLDAHYDDIAYFVNAKDRTDLFEKEEDYEHLRALIMVLFDNITEEQLTSFMYELSNPKKYVGFNALFSMMDYSDKKLIDKVTSSRLLDLFPKDDTKLEIPIVDDGYLTREEWTNVCTNAYKVLTNIYLAPSTSSIEYMHSVRRIMASENILEEIAFKELGMVTNYSGKLLSGIHMPSGTAKAVGHYLLADNVMVTSLSLCPVTAEQMVKIMENITLHELMYNVLGDYPHMERVLNNAFYLVKTKTSATLLDTMSSECTAYAHATFDENGYLTEPLVREMFAMSRNIDDVDFTDDERVFWTAHAEHFFGKTTA